MSPVEDIIQLAKDAEAKISVTFNSPDVLPFTTRALSIIESNRDQQSEFEHEFMNMSHYATEAGVHRLFCGTCGSSIIGKRESMPEIIRVRIGTLDTPVEEKISAHIFVGSKAEWYEICDDAPKHEERP